LPIPNTKIALLRSECFFRELLAFPSALNIDAGAVSSIGQQN
jgi:hypothetical protein